MTLNPTGTQSLRRVFNDGFSANDIAEPLVSFDATRSATEILAIMEEAGYEVVGVREKGVVTGYLEKNDLTEGTCDMFTKPFDNRLAVV